MVVVVVWEERENNRNVKVVEVGNRDCFVSD